MTVSVGGLTWNCTTCDGTLAISGVGLQRLAWCAGDMSQLYGTPALVGEDKPLPDAMVVAYKRTATTTRHSFPFSVNGHWDRFGVATALGVEAQLEANLAYLNAFVLLPTNLGDGTRPVVWTTPGGNTVTVSAHVLGLGNPQRLPGGLLRATLELSVPQGTLHL